MMPVVMKSSEWPSPWLAKFEPPVAPSQATYASANGAITAVS